MKTVKHRFLVAGLAGLVLSVGLSGCGDGDPARRDATTAAPADTTSDTALVDTSATESSDTAVPDATAADTAPPETTAPDTSVATETADAVADECRPGSLGACRYPSLDLDYVEREGFTTTEPVTGRSLPLLARIPLRAGPLPVVIWSHGGAFFAGGEKESVAWGDTFARHGYVVIHVGHSVLDGAGVRLVCAQAGVPSDDCLPSEDEDSNGLLAVARSNDLKAVLDDLSRLSGLSVSSGGPALDLDKVAVAGGSGGSRGPMVVMGAKVLTMGAAPPFANPHPRPVAALFMSPSGPPFGGFFNDADGSSYDTLRGPTISFTGTNDQKPAKPELTGAVRRTSFDAQPSDGKRWLLYSNLAVGVGGHGTFNLGDIDSDDNQLLRLSEALASAARAFLDAHVRGDAAAAAWLATPHARVLAGDAEWEHH